MRRGEAGSRINFEQLLIYLIDNCLRYENRIGFDGLCAVCEAQDETGGAEDYGALGTGVYDGDADWHAAGQRGADEGAGSVCGVSREATEGTTSSRGYCGIRARGEAQAQGGEGMHITVYQAHKYTRQKGGGGGDGEERGCYGDGSEEGEKYDGEEREM